MVTKRNTLVLLAALAGGAIVILTLRGGSSGPGPSPRPSPSPSPAAGGTRTAYTADELFQAIIRGEVDPDRDTELLTTVYASLPPEARELWMTQLATLIGGLEPGRYAELQRIVGYLALSNGYHEAGWTALESLLHCDACSEFYRIDTLRLLNMYTPPSGLHRKDLTEAVIAKANAVLAGDSLDKQPLPLIWSAVMHLRAAGRLQEAIDMQRLHSARFASVLRPIDLVNEQASIAFDLLTLGKLEEARPVFLTLAEANRSAAMSWDRANFLAFAAKSGSSDQAVVLLETALSDPVEARTAASTILYLRLLEAHQDLGNRLAAAQVAEQFWRERGPNGVHFAAAVAGLSAESSDDAAAAVCFSAAILAQQRNQWAEADLWYQRVLEAAPNTVTAQAVRDMLARR